MADFILAFSLAEKYIPGAINEVIIDPFVEDFRYGRMPGIELAPSKQGAIVTGGYAGALCCLLSEAELSGHCRISLRV